MPVKKKSKTRTEFGDFQTPIEVCRRVLKLLAQQIAPACVIEPTCGRGNFLIAALDQFPALQTAIGLEINRQHVSAAKAALAQRPDAGKAHIIRDSFFHADWRKLLCQVPEPILVVGNPPWVTNAELGSLGSVNLPEKSNFQNLGGLDALTGKSNFDISEWMLLQTAQWLEGRRGALAMLCKTSVARRVLRHVWSKKMSVVASNIYRIDAGLHFDARVDACLLVCRFAPGTATCDAGVYARLTDDRAVTKIGYREGRLVADVPAFERWKHLEGAEVYQWRSGVKHDCAKVMELRRAGDKYQNGLGEVVELESDYLYPMVKTSELANGAVPPPRRWMLVPQRSVNEETATIKERAPKTWAYLVAHAGHLDARASAIYKIRPRFSIFGIGDYSFAPYKVATSGFYKKLRFVPLGRFARKPIMLDDASYFIACRSEEESAYLAGLLNSEIAKDFYSSFIFWDAKRPITVELLRRLDLRALARAVGSEATLEKFEPRKVEAGLFQQVEQ